MSGDLSPSGLVTFPGTVIVMCPGSPVTPWSLAWRMQWVLVETGGLHH